MNKLFIYFYRDAYQTGQFQIGAIRAKSLTAAKNIIKKQRVKECARQGCELKNDYLLHEVTDGETQGILQKGNNYNVDFWYANGFKFTP